jgi:hypothetical protein
MEVSDHLDAPAVLSPSTHWIGGWVGPKDGLNVVERRQVLPMPGFKPRPSSPYPVAIPTELSQLRCVCEQFENQLLALPALVVRQQNH